MREILFIVASRYERDFVSFRQRLAAGGKPPKVVRIALAHKLLVRLKQKPDKPANDSNSTTQQRNHPTPKGCLLDNQDSR